MNPMKNASIIVAGGLGSRMNSQLPKQFMDLGGKPVLQWSLESFASAETVEKLVLVLPKDWIEESKNFLKSFKTSKSFIIVQGGKLRQDSVLNGLNALDESFDFVAVHDAARPGITKEAIEKGFDKAARNGNAVFVMPSYDTLAVVEADGIVDNLDRNKVFRVQTPQIFRCSHLKIALNKAKEEHIVGTDEASLIRLLGHKVYIVEGSEKLAKITTATDLKRAEFLLEKGVS